ncbi:hypothetical protein N7513_009484 [Penicillium frequentans]|uniref:Pheromone-regulated membrane protein 10 n=1 Tax=Penicillium frequentans TaxID=3151616 RepID=A0AAD6CIZ6_9EURO|nr:hypothetical protein N7494_011014 [Penicillium glabrum]KAJ5536298.1 hypothetical protein N7513_009484 [Penicillium glabrum]
MSDLTPFPHPSPAEEYSEFPFPTTPSSRQSLEREPTADDNPYIGLQAPTTPTTPTTPEAEPQIPATELEPQIEARIRSPRVRFRSLSRLSERYLHPSDSHRVFSDKSDASNDPLLPPAELRNVPLNSGTVTPPAPAHSRHGGRSPPVEFSEKSEKEDPDSVERTSSARNRFRAAGQLIRQKTTKLTERLGRPSDDGEALNASLLPDDFDNIPLEELQARRARRDADNLRSLEAGEEVTQPAPSAEAHRLVRSMTMVQDRLKRKPRGAYQRSGQTTPEGLLRDYTAAARRRSSNFGGGGSGILSQLLKLQAVQTGSSSRPESVITDDSDSETQFSSGGTTPKKGSRSPSMLPSMPTSGAATPRKEKLKWYKKSAHRSTSSLVNASMNFSSASLPAAVEAMPPGKRPKKNKRKTRLEDEIRVTVHIAEIISRQRYIMQLCRALMRYGAPTHRLEEYMQMTARVLDISGQFLYLPGCMIMSFDDPATRTAEVKLVRMVQGVDLGRLADTHNVYKNVVHDLIGVEEASQELDDIMQRKPRYNKWLIVLLYGIASTAVGPFAFEARPIDMPIIFLLGSLVGFMQHVLAPRSVLYSNVFEVTAAILTSFLARALGSIEVNGSRLFCFSALAQSSIALILPGFTVLCSSLELQSHQIIAGSIRMVYAIIYSLFLGYGITVGLTIYGLMDSNASSQTSCPNLDVYGSVYVRKFPFVAIYAVFLALVNQAKWKQMPVMVFIATAGYIANYFSTLKFGSSSEVANTVGAFTVGVLGNLYSRLWHGHAATAILPGIFVLVPSGLASSGSLLSGLNYANEVIAGNTSSTSDSDTSVSSLGYGMIQVAIGITVGLFMSALIIYPFGKKRTGLFSF